MDCHGMEVALVSSRLRRMGDDAFLLAEANHRVANEIAAATAALRLVKAAKGSRSRWRLLGDAIERLEAFAVTHRHFAAARSDGARVDVGAGLADVCSALAVARRSARGSTMSLDLPSTFVDPTTARNLALVADELVTNAIKYGLEGRAGMLIVSLRDDGQQVHLVVSDDGPGIAPNTDPDGSGLGSGIVAELVRRSGGEIAYRTGCHGTTVHVSMPYRNALDA